MKIGIISSLGEQTYQGKYNNRKEIWSSFWEMALFQNDKPIDVVDYFEILNKKNSLCNNEYSRHIYTNGILLTNRLRNHSKEIILFNSLKKIDLLSNFDLVIISTNYIYNDWFDYLSHIIDFLNKRKIKCIIGGIGIKRLYINNSIKFNVIKNKIDGYIIISDSGLPKLFWAINNLENINQKTLICTEEYQLEINDFSLFNIDKKFHSNHTTFATQSGCVYNCSFCTYKEKYNKHIYYDSEVVKKAIIQLYQSNINKLKHLRIVDETFNTNINKSIAFCKFITSQKFDFSWSCFLKADNINSSLIKALSMSNCNLVSIGVESGSSSMQKVMNKNINLKKLTQNILELKEYGIKVNISLLVGFFNECESSIKETIDYIKLASPDFARINIWYPSLTKSNSSLFSNNNFKMYDDKTWEHNSLSEKQAVEYAKKIYLTNSKTIFLPPFSSIFDQWPVLASYGLSSDEIVKIFKDYYELSKVDKV